MMPSAPKISLFDSLEVAPKVAPGGLVTSDLFSRIVTGLETLAPAGEMPATPAQLVPGAIPALTVPKLRSPTLPADPEASSEADTPEQEAEQPDSAEPPQAELIAVLTGQPAPQVAPAAVSVVMAAPPAPVGKAVSADVLTAAPLVPATAEPTVAVDVEVSKATAAPMLGKTVQVELPAMPVPPALKQAVKHEKPVETVLPVATRPIDAAPAAILAAVGAPVESPAAAASPSPIAVAEPAIEPMVEQQLDLAHESEWLDRLAKDIARAGAADGPLRFRLHPESLGSLQVELTQQAAGTSIRMTADSETARAIIADAQPRLVAEARAQGVRIAETHVDLGGGGQAQAGGQQGQGQARQDALLRTFGGDRAEASASPAAKPERSDRYA